MSTILWKTKIKIEKVVMNKTSNLSQYDILILCLTYLFIHVFYIHSLFFKRIFQNTPIRRKTINASQQFEVHLK